MIYANLSEARCYLGLHPRLDRALGFLMEDYLRAVPTVRMELEGNGLFVTRFDVPTSADEGRLFEYHRQYLDIFAVVAGEERVDIATPEKLTLREQHDDYWGCGGKAEQSVILKPGRFLVLFPGDAHRPGMAVTEPAGVTRVVFKIRYVDEGD